MRISVYLEDEGQVAILLQPGRGLGLPPIYVPHVAAADVVATVTRELERIAALPPRGR